MRTYRLLSLCLLIVALLAACGPAARPPSTATAIPTATTVPTGTPAPTAPTATVTPARPTPIPTPEAPITPTPALEGMEGYTWSAASPDGQWIVEGRAAFPTTGENYYTHLKVLRADGSIAWTVVDEWSHFGLGYTTPRAFHWSQDGRYLYFTNEPVPDGCAVFVNGSDLWKIDLIDGSVTQVVPSVGLWLTLSPDEATLGYVGYGDRGLVLRDLTTGTEREVRLDPGQAYQAGQITWSPDGAAVVLTLAIRPCSKDWAESTSIVRVETATLEQTTLIRQDSRLFTILEWPTADRVLLADNDARRWWMDAVTGYLWQASRPSDPVGARDAVLAYLAENYGSEAPTTGLVWTEKHTKPEGLVGGESYEYTAGDWVIAVSYPVVAPENVVYTIVVGNQATGFHWEGQVDAQGQVTETSAATELASDGWKIYRNRTLGYRFDYPADASVSSADDPLKTVTITGPLVGDEYWPIIFINHPSDRADYRPPEGADLTQWLTDHNLVVDERQPDMQIAGAITIHTRRSRSPQAFASDSYYFARSGQLYTIVILHTGDKEDWTLYDRFLASFQFDQ